MQVFLSTYDGKMCHQAKANVKCSVLNKLWASCSKYSSVCLCMCVCVFSVLYLQQVLQFVGELV